MARPPYVGSGRAIEGGALATRKQDFNAHVDGTSFRQMADTVDITTIEGVVGTTVQAALESLNNLITSAGSGFISIGLADGYAQGSYTVGSEGYASLRDAFNAAVADERLTNGGVILILAGTYSTTATITVPSGITVLGEMGGTIIIGEMPDIPMFQIDGTSNRITIGGDDGSGDLVMDSGGKPEGVKFVNLMLADNLDGYASFGAPSMTSVPMIRCSIDSHFTCEQVRFIGRLTQASPPRTSTYAAIGYSSGSSSGTHLNLKGCFFDGIMVPVRFTPGGGDVDSLSIDGCRARVIGMDDDAADGDNASNCFVNLTACQASITNNHICPGPHTYMESAIYVSESYGDNSKIIISGTRGFSADADPTYGTLVGTDGSAIAIMQHGNNWGSSTGEWYVVAGLDYLGAGSIDAIVANVAYNGIVYVYGNATVTSIGSQYLKLVGIGMPRVSLAVATVTSDTFTSNRKFEIGPAKNIHFVCDTAYTALYHTVVATRDASSTYLHFDNCIFENCALVVNESTSDSFKNLSITNSQFLQDGDYAANISMVLPAADVTLVDNCYFYLNGGGYVGGIGDSSTYNSAMTDCTVTVSNCIMSLGTGASGAIDIASPLVGTRDHFFWIAESTARINLNNCKITASETYDRTDAVTQALTDAATFTKFIYLNGRTVAVDNCRIVSIDMMYESGGINYQLPALYIEPTEFCTINNTVINYGMCQVGGTTAFLALSGSSGTTAQKLLNSGLTVTNSSFLAKPSDYSLTAFSVDVDLSSVPEFIRPRIVFDGCIFEGSSVADGTAGVQHTAYTGAAYDVQGVVQVYAGMCDVFVSNCVIRGAIAAPSSSVQTEFSGLIVNNVDGDTLSDQLVSSTTINNNKIYVDTTYATTVGIDDVGVASVNVKSPTFNISNNFITLYFSGAETSDSYLECLRMDCADAVGYGDAMVCNNIFSYRSETGAVGMLNSGFIKIATGSASGSFINNSFSDREVYTSTGTSTKELIDDASNSWLIHGNKNHEKTLTVTNGMGHYSVSSSSSTRLGGAFTSTVNSYIIGSSTGGNDLEFDYVGGDLGTTITFNWTIPGSLLPYGVTVTKATLNYQLATSSILTTKDLTVSILSEDGTDGVLAATSTNAATTRSAPSSGEAVYNHVNYPENNVRIIVKFTVMDAADSATFDISSLEIMYHW